MAEVGIIMGSKSDLPVLNGAVTILEQLECDVEVGIVSAHRTPEKMVSYAKAAAGQGLQVIIAGAGGAAHLPGMVASLTPLPVIGVPVRSSHLQGLDSLLSIVQMPRGVPVATVAINGGSNAGLLAARILALGTPALRERLQSYMDAQRSGVEEDETNLRSLGVAEFLRQQGHT
jgi:5-(carboxyamino)imidazole ribonucleotide mutase